MAQIEVRVRNKQSGEERTITYKSYVDTQSLFDLLGQVDENGVLTLGDPNLLPQHQRKSVNVTAASVGKIQAPPFVTTSTALSEEELIQKREKLLAQLPQDSPIVQLNQKVEESKQEAKEPETVVEPVKEKRKYTKRIKETA